MGLLHGPPGCHFFSDESLTNCPMVEANVESPSAAMLLMRSLSKKNNLLARAQTGQWWAGQDSNLQPDRYERPALTIELPARKGARGA